MTLTRSASEAVYTPVVQERLSPVTSQFVYLLPTVASIQNQGHNLLNEAHLGKSKVRIQFTFSPKNIIENT